MKAILIDFGSTFTKIIVVDLKKHKILGRSNSPSTANTDISIGLRNAMRDIGIRLSDLKQRKFDYQLSCSSAAGGLKMVAIGLVPQLTVQAAKNAALGAGANVLDVYSYELSKDEVVRIEAQEPDLILLAGGSDGGDKKTVLHNARMLAKSKITSPIIISCNKVVADNVKKILNEYGKITRITDNVMPELWSLNIEPAKKEIRKIFLDRIVIAKGLEKIKEIVDTLIPTPSASMIGAELLAKGVENQGLGDLLAIEVGGATTNVYSVSEGKSIDPRAIIQGFKEPYVKRTVEGDLGLRYNATSIVKMVREEEFKEVLRDEGFEGEGDIYENALNLRENISFLPNNIEDYAFDMTLSRIAVRVAVRRHSGQFTEVKLPIGVTLIQSGKDLRNIKNVIGTGGGIVYQKHHKRILSEALFDPKESHILRPKRPKIFVDKDYVLWAMGLLANFAPKTAYSIIRNSLTLV